MSKRAAIDYAVRRQLATDNKAPPTTYKEIMGAAPARAAAAAAAVEAAVTTASAAAKEAAEAAARAARLPEAEAVEAGAAAGRRAAEAAAVAAKAAIDAAAAARGAAAPVYYGYDEPAIIKFLVGVATQLQRDIPALSCRWAECKLPDCLAADVEGIEDLIAEVTT